MWVVTFGTLNLRPQDIKSIIHQCIVWQMIYRDIKFHMQIYTERLFVRINRKSESYFRIISFQSVANRVYVSEINIVDFKGQSWYFRLYKMEYMFYYLL